MVIDLRTVQENISRVVNLIDRKRRDLADEHRVFELQVFSKLLEYTALTAVSGHYQTRFRNLFLNQCECSQHAIDAVVTFQISIRQKLWPERRSIAKTKFARVDQVVDRCGFQSVRGKHTHEILGRNNNRIDQSNRGNRSSSPATQVILRLTAVIVEQNFSSIEFPDQDRRRGRKHERKIRR